MRPPAPSNIVIFHQLFTFKKPGIRIFPGFTQPKWNIITTSKSKVILDRRLICYIPVFVKTIYHIYIKLRSKLKKIRSIPVSLNKDNVIVIYFSNCISDLHIQTTQVRVIIAVRQNRFI